MSVPSRGLEMLEGSRGFMIKQGRVSIGVVPPALVVALALDMEAGY